MCPVGSLTNEAEVRVRKIRMTTSTARRTTGIIVVVLLSLVLGAATMWAALTVLQPAEDPSEMTHYTHVAVIEGTVGSEISLNTVAEWQPVPVGDNRAQGVVTSITLTAGDEVGQGSILYSVNLRPVVVAQGEVPAFRAIDGEAEGPDVAQLQQMLVDLGFYGNVVDGVAGAGTVTAIKAWQKSLGLEQTGKVEAADVIFVPTLPTRLVLDTEKLFRGATLMGGEAVVRGLSTSPIFTLPVTESQAAMIPAGTRVEITSPNGDMWVGHATEVTRDSETQTVIVHLAGPDDVAVCANACEQVPVTGQAQLASRVVTVEEVEGLVIPSAALVTTADGTTAVIDEDGERTPVTVVTSARGMSVVEGVTAGTQVRVPAQETGSGG